MSPSTPRILVVDDNESLVRIIEGVLRNEGFQVLTAFDGIDGLEKAIREMPDLVILDIEMPRMNGYEVCRRLQRSEDTARIPVLMLSVKGQVDTKANIDGRTMDMRVRERNRGFEVGAIEFISKPVKARALVEQVKKLLWIDPE
jgi:DNA-binding response OmpR family regulator